VVGADIMSVLRIPDDHVRCQRSLRTTWARPPTCRMLSTTATLRLAHGGRGWMPAPWASSPVRREAAGKAGSACAHRPKAPAPTPTSANTAPASMPNPARRRLLRGLRRHRARAR